MAGRGPIALEQKATCLTLILIVLWGLMLRLYSLEHQSLWLDESISALVIEKIAETGTPLLDSGKLYYPGKPHTYIAAFFYNLWGRNVFALRLVSVIFGTAMIPLAYFSCKILYKQRLSGIIAALLISLNYLEIAWSRQIRLYAEYQFFFSLSLILFYVFISRKTTSSKLAAALALSAVITVLLHMSGVMLFIPFIFMVLLYIKKAKLKRVPLVILFICLIITFYLQYIFPTHDIKTTSIINTEKINIISTLSFTDHFILFIVKNHTLFAVSFFFAVIYAIYSINKVHIILLATLSTIILGLSAQHISTMRSLFVLTPLFVYLTAHFLTVSGRMLIIACRKLPFRNLSPSSLDHKVIDRPAYMATVILTALFLGISSTAADHFVLLPEKSYFLEYDPTFDSPDDLLFFPQAVMQGKQKVSKAPFTYWNRYRLKQRLQKELLNGISGTREQLRT